MYFKNESILEIDGSFGEGEGQVLRTSLAISKILKRPIKIFNIRSKRKNQGLQAQHLKGIEALIQITGGRAEGVKIGCQTVTFISMNISMKIKPGKYYFNIGTAGSITLLLQTLIPPLSLAEDKSRLIITGWTHVQWNPPYHYFSYILIPILRIMEIKIRSGIDKWGWYPVGGGRVRVEVEPTKSIKPIHLIKRGSLMRIKGISATCNLPKSIAERQKAYIMERVEKELKMGIEDIEIISNAPGEGKGSFLFVSVESEESIAGFSSLGERGKRLKM